MTKPVTLTFRSTSTYVGMPPPDVAPDLTLDHEVTQFYARQGRLFSRWTVLESLVFRVFVRSLGSPHWDAASAAFHAVPTFRSRLAMTQGAVGMRLPDGAPLRAEWDALKGKIEKLSGKRNKVAHWMTVTNGQEPVGRRVWLTQTIDNASVLPRLTGKQAPKLYVTDLWSIDEDFRLASNDLDGWLSSLDPDF